jgi:acyl dehydratase
MNTPAPPPDESRPGAGIRHPPDLGSLYEDFVAGDTHVHWPGRTLLDADNSWFTLLTMNTHPLHFDAAWAREQSFGRPLVNSLLTLSIVTGMSVRETSQRAVANLGWSEVRLLAPVFVGDTLYAESRILGKRLSRSRPGEGIVEVQTCGFNEHRTLVIEFKRSFLVPCRDPATAASRAAGTAP